MFGANLLKRGSRTRKAFYGIGNISRGILWRWDWRTPQRTFRTVSRIWRGKRAAGA